MITVLLTAQLQDMLQTENLFCGTEKSHGDHLRSFVDRRLPIQHQRA